MNCEEIELTLVLCSETPEAVADEVAELTDIGAYRLRPRPEMAIHDVYFDLADRSLSAHELGLRLRVVDGCGLITLKGKAEGMEGGGKRREEIEQKWSADAMNVVVARLADHGVEPATADPFGHWNDPHAVLSQMGFVAEQTRDTRRRPRDVVMNEDSPFVLAELAVDSVVYRFRSGEVRHHEVEIEVKGDGGVTAMQGLSRELRRRWPESLRLWDHGKWSTGRAVEALIAQRDRLGLLNNLGDLTPEAYDLIAVHLR